MVSETPRRSATVYVAFTTALAWVLWAVGALVFPGALVAFVLTVRRRRDARRLLGRLVRWRVGLR